MWFSFSCGFNIIPLEVYPFYVYCRQLTLTVNLIWSRLFFLSSDGGWLLIRMKMSRGFVLDYVNRSGFEMLSLKTLKTLSSVQNTRMHYTPKICRKIIFITTYITLICICNKLLLNGKH